MSEDLIYILLATLGLIAHFLKKLVEVKNSTGRLVRPSDYWLANPYTSLSSIVLCAAGLLMLWGTDELTRMSAFTFGYMADSVINMLMKRHA